MSETLLIHYNIENEQQATWSLCNEAGELTGKITTGSLEELSSIAHRYPIVVLLNSQCLHINELQLPTQNPQKLLRAVPYALEEVIAGDIDEFHFVINKNKHNNLTAVVGIDRTTLQNIIQIFNSHKINIEKIIPDALCLAANEEQWVCLNHENNTYLQTNQLAGMLISHDVFPYVLDSKLNDEKIDKPKKLLLFNEQDNTDAFAQLSIDHDDIETLNIAYNAHPLVVFCGNYKQALPLNLLQHSFKPKRKTSGQWHHWRLTASLAVVWLILHLGLTGFKAARLEQENIVDKAQIEKIYRQSFPKSKRIVNPRVQMEQKLNELKSSAGDSNSGLLFLLSESFGSIDQDKKNITLQTLNFRNNRMEIGLESTNLQAIETLNKKLNQSNSIKSEITSSSAEKGKVKGNLRIEGRS